MSHDADFSAKAAVLFLLLSFVVAEKGPCHNFTLTTGCTCKYNATSELTDFACVDANLTSFPPELPSTTNTALNVRIQNNSIEVIEQVPYADVIQNLYLPSNIIRYIKDGAFSKLTSLKTLDLRLNQITSIRESTFDGLTNLKILNFQGNPLYSLKTGTFNGQVLPQLITLDFGGCQLYEVEDDAISGLDNLQSLSLSHNNLKTVPLLGCPGQSLRTLVTFDISYNKISHVQPSNCSLPALHHFNLNHNRIQKINASFWGLSGRYLDSLHLGHNEISSIDVDAFNGSLNLTMLDISSNKLTNLDNGIFNWSQMQSVIVISNPWDCACDNLWLSTQEIINKDEVWCATPLEVLNKSIRSVQDTIFNQCSTKGQTHVVAIVVGLLLTVVAVVVGCLVVYFMINRRRSHSDIGSSSSGLRTGSSIYRRMNTGNEVLFDYSSGTPGDNSGNANEQRPVWKEMTGYEQNNNPFS